MAHIAALSELGGVDKNKTGFVERAVGVHDGVPVAVFAELIGGDAIGINDDGGTSLERAVEIKIDTSGDVVGINFLGVDETVGGVGELTGALELDAPIIKCAGIKIGDEQGVGIYVPLVVQVYE